VVVEEVEDLDLGAVGEEPFGGVGLPELVGEISCEAVGRRVFNGWFTRLIASLLNHRSTSPQGMLDIPWAKALASCEDIIF